MQPEENLELRDKLWSVHKQLKTLGLIQGNLEWRLCNKHTEILLLLKYESIVIVEILFGPTRAPTSLRLLKDLELKKEKKVTYLKNKIL